MNSQAGDYIESYLAEAGRIVAAVDRGALAALVAELLRIRSEKGRIFFLGVGGSAANASHAVNDFRKIAGIECYAPTDNVSELTARVNDEGWETVFSRWLEGSRLSARDGVFIFSVGGGSVEKNISLNLVRAVELAQRVGASIMGIVGRDGGFTARASKHCIIIPTVNENTVTPHTESFQSVLWHMLVSHPDLRASEMKWESAAR